jgi:O-antigen/teichoic acid export membrane protein
MKTYLTNTGWMMLEKIMRMFVTIVVWSAVIRYLSPADFGILSFALSFIFIFSVISDGGFETVLVRDLIHRPQDAAVLMGSSYQLRWWLTLFSIAVAAILCWALPLEGITRILIMIAGIRLLALPFLNLDNFFQSRLSPNRMVVSQILALILTSVLCFWGISQNMPLYFFAAVVVLEGIAAMLGLWLFYQPVRMEVGAWRIDKALVKDLWRQSWPLILSGLAISIYMRLDQWMIKFMLGNDALGYYSAAVRFSESFYFIGMAVSSAFFPSLVQAKKDGQDKYMRQMLWLTSVLIYIAIICSILMVVAGLPLIEMLITAKYDQAMPVLTVHVWTSVFVFIGLLRTKWAINEGLQIFSMQMTLLGAVVNIVLNLTFIPLWGIIGAAWATMAAQCFVAVFSNLFHPKARKLISLQFQALDPRNLKIKQITWA